MTDKIVKGTIQFEDRKIIIEGPSDFVESMVAKYTNASKQQAKPGQALETPSTPAATGMGERELVAAKQPHGHPEVVAVLAFALTEPDLCFLPHKWPVFPIFMETPPSRLGSS